MALTNREIADTFETVADMLQLRGDVIHRVLSYRRAADTIRELPRDLRAVSAEKGLTDLPGIGKTLADKINEMLQTGELAFYTRLAGEIPPGLVRIMHVNGVGPEEGAAVLGRAGHHHAGSAAGCRGERPVACAKGHGRQERAKHS